MLWRMEHEYETVGGTACHEYIQMKKRVYGRLEENKNYKQAIRISYFPHNQGRAQHTRQRLWKH